MVRFGLRGRPTTFWRKSFLVISSLLLLWLPVSAGKQRKTTTLQAGPPDLLLDGGRKLTFERSFSLEREVKPKRSFWTRGVDVIAGEPDFHFLVNPYSITTDSRGRVIITDTGAHGIHVFDFGTEVQISFAQR